MTRAQIIAGFSAFAALAVFLLGPLLLYRLVSGIPLNGDGPSWEVWLLVVGGGIGAGAARFVHHHILVGRFGKSEDIEEKSWRGR